MVQYPRKLFEAILERRIEHVPSKTSDMTYGRCVPTRSRCFSKNNASWKRVSNLFGAFKNRLLNLESILNLEPILFSMFSPVKKSVKR